MVSRQTQSAEIISRHFHVNHSILRIISKTFFYLCRLVPLTLPILNIEPDSKVRIGVPIHPQATIALIGATIAICHQYTCIAHYFSCRDVYVRNTYSYGLTFTHTISVCNVRRRARKKERERERERKLEGKLSE